MQLIHSSLFSDANLKAYYRFEGNSNDAKGTNNGSDTDITYSTANGRYGQGAGFNGSSSVITIADAAVLKPTGNFSVGFWIKVNGNPAAPQYIFQTFSQNPNVAGVLIAITASGYIEFNSGKNTGTLGGTDYQAVTSSHAVTDNKFHLVVCTYDGTNLNIYTDLYAVEQQAWNQAAAYAATNYVRIGCKNFTGTNAEFFSGNLDEVFLNNGTAVSAANVQTLYADAGFLGIL